MKQMETTVHNVLVVSDSFHFLDLLTKKLEDEGFHVLSTHTVSQALALFHQSKVSCLILHDILPDDSVHSLRQAFYAANETKVCTLFTLHESDNGEAEYLQHAKGLEVVMSRVGFLNLMQHEGNIRNWLLDHLLSTGRYKKLTSSKQALLIEDNELNQNYIVALIAGMGFNTQVTGNGLDAWEMLHNYHYDLVLTDISLPGMDGIELTRKIRKEFSDSLPVIGISGFSEPEIRASAIMAGMNHVIIKPFSKIELSEALLKVIPEMLSNTDTSSSQLLEPKLNNSTEEYDYSQALEIAKGDDGLFLKWLQRFNEIVKNAKYSIDQAIQSNNFPERNKDFHELMNYSGYYGLSELRSHILELLEFQKITRDEEVQKIFYLNIKPEIEKVLAFYSNLLQNYSNQAVK